MNEIIASMMARNLTSCQGSFQNQPRRPFPPRLRPVLSKVANNANAVSNEGTAIARLMNKCMNFRPSVNPGSTIWWWNPPGTFSTTIRMTTALARESLNNFPPMTFGTTMYHAETATRYQTLTSVCPNAQNKVLVSRTFIVSIQPSVQGMI